MDNRAFVECLDELIRSKGKKVRCGGVDVYELPQKEFDDANQFCLTPAEPLSLGDERVDIVVRLTCDLSPIRCESHLSDKGWIYIVRAKHKT